MEEQSVFAFKSGRLAWIHVNRHVVFGMNLINFISKFAVRNDAYFHPLLNHSPTRYFFNAVISGFLVCFDIHNQKKKARNSVPLYHISSQAGRNFPEIAFLDCLLILSSQLSKDNLLRPRIAREITYYSH